MIENRKRKTVLSAAVLMLITVLAPFRCVAINSPQREIKTVESLVIHELNLSDVARLLTQMFNQPVMTTPEVSDMLISTYLEGLSFSQMIAALCRAHNLDNYYEPESGVLYLIPGEHYESQLNHINNNDTQNTINISLMYPRAIDVADTIQKLYLEKVIWEEPLKSNGDNSRQIEQALMRMDKLGSRTSFDSNESGSATSGSSTNNSTETSSDTEMLLTDDETGNNDVSLLKKKGEHAIYMSVFPSTNVLLLRSHDTAGIQDIERLVKSLDKPTPQVLLEVKILEINLEDTKIQGIDWLFSSTAGNNSGGFTSGIIAGAKSLTPSELLIRAQSVGDINTALDGAGSVGLDDFTNSLLPQGDGFDSRAAVFTHISDSFKARLRLLQTEGRLTKLATPTLLVADNEASRVFVGTNTKYLERVDVIAGQSTQGVITTSTLVPVIESRNIGTSLLITPKIHADRTVTLRIMQEYSTLGGLRDIDYGAATTIKVQDVQQQVITTTVVAKDKSMLVLGGLIREGVEETVEAIPGLMDIPYLGALFKRTSHSRYRKELILMVRPYILLAPGEAQTASANLLSRTSQHPSANRQMNGLNVTKSSDILIPGKRTAIDK